MNYYTNEHRTAEGHQATVHVGSCESCKNGAGILGVCSPENGKWHGPFRSLSAAKSVVPRVNAEVHACAQLRADPMQQAESFAGQRIEPEPDEAVRSNETLARLLRVIEGTGFAGDIRGAPQHIAQPDRPAHLELLKSVTTIPAATLTATTLPPSAPTQQMGSYAGQRIEPQPDEAPRRDATLAALLRAIESTDLAEDLRGTSPPIAQRDKAASSQPDIFTPPEPLKSIDTVPAANLSVATPTSAAPTQEAESLRATESMHLAEDLREAPQPIAQPDKAASSEPLKSVDTIPAATLSVATPPPAAPTQEAESLRATERMHLAEDLREAPQPIAQPDKPALPELPKGIDTIPAVTLPVATPTSAASTQQAESLRATESMHLAEDLRGALPPIAQPDKAAPTEPLKSIDTVPAATLPVAPPPQQAESLRATESMHLAEDLRGAPPPIAQPDRPTPPEPLKSIDTIPVTTLPVAVPTSAAPTQVTESPVVQQVEPLIDHPHAPTPSQTISAATEKAPDSARPGLFASVEGRSPRTAPRKRQSIWFRNLLPRDPRRSQRLVKPPLVAYYWTGGTPIPHTIADISSSGLFMLTEDLWYPGSILSMTLQRTDQRRGTPESWIAVNLLVIRRTDDGLGAAFVPSMPGTAHAATGREQSSVDTRTLERFVKDLTASTQGHY